MAKQSIIKQPAETDGKARYLDYIDTYEREAEAWENRAKKIQDRYLDKGRENRNSTSESSYNILWANVQTLTAATFSKIPKPDVSRRFKDNDPVGRVAGMILERALDYEVEKYATYGATLRSVVQDRFLGGRGTAWVRYEPHFKAGEKQQPEDGLEISEDVDEPQEELDYECAPADYVHWQDFGHVIARTWEEVPAVWRKVYLTRDQCIERFPDIGDKLPLDASPADKEKRKAGNEGVNSQSRALVYEIWDKTTKEAIWLSKSLNQIVDRKLDPLGLDDFFPCPKPLYATLSNDSLIPVPDFTLYQDQANMLNMLSDRITGLIQALKVAGGYDASVPEIKRIFTEGSNTTLIPVKNWAAFAEKQGLRGTISLVDLTPIINALHGAYEAMQQVKQQIYDITGISDIIRGQTTASETATAQQIKGQYATLRLKSFQDEVARFATEILRIQSQIICKQFSPQTLAMISAADQLPQADQPIVPKAIEMLTQAGPNPVRMFRIDVAADSLIQLDESQEKQDRMEFLTTFSGFLEKVAPLGQSQPAMLPVIGELLKYGARSFKAGKTLEGAIDSAIDSIGKQPPVNPAIEQAKKQLEQGKQQLDQQQKQIEQSMQQLKAQQDKVTQASNHLDQQKSAMALQQAKLEQMASETDKAFEKWKAELDARTRIAVAEIPAKTTLSVAQLNAAKAEAKSSDSTAKNNGAEGT